MTKAERQAPPTSSEIRASQNSASVPSGAPSLYASFDRYPSNKGAAVHIREFADTLFEVTGGGILHVLGGDDLPAYQQEFGTGDDGGVDDGDGDDGVDDSGGVDDGGDRKDGLVEIVRFCESVPNLLDRISAYGSQLHHVAAASATTLRIVHARDPWSVAPIWHGGLAGAGATNGARLVYEVNGLPSVELPYAYPGLGTSTLAKVRSLEFECLMHADAIVTPSAVLAGRLRELAPDAAPVTVIPNGARPPVASPGRPNEAPPRYIIYVGALQPWQGIDTLLAAFARLADLDDLRLVVCSATPPKRARPWQRLAARLEVDGRVDWHFKVPHRDIAGWLAHAELSVAPLSDCSRNVDQGCCPLKVLESMAVATPVVASDLAVIRELVTDGEHGRLVPPGRPAELARAIRVALEFPDQTRAQGQRAQRHVNDHLTWDHSRAALRSLYQDLLTPN